ncbi:MAG TPA: glycosyltransferase family 4 protein [Anaerolineales bacterium]|nr:glycosyltransferase family 4 protein [Anaerolineales bacterium]
MSASPFRLNRRRIGFVSTRFSGTDGVSLETEKWATVLERLGHACFYFSGQSDRPAECSRVVPEAFFGHPAIAAIGNAAFDSAWGADELLEYANPEIYPIHTPAFHHRIRPPSVTRRIHELADYLKKQLYAFARELAPELLIVENALTIPMNIPLGVALTEFIAETGFPAIAHHHDFYWERQRFLVNCVGDYLHMAFPPNLPSVHHVVLNSLAAQQLSLRTGLSSMIIPNVMDFEHPPAPPDDYTTDVRAALGVAPDELLFLQPTRVVQRKGIEHAIELIRRLGLKARLVVSHASGDEGNDYEKRVREFATLLGVTSNFVADIIQDKRGLTPEGRKVYTLADVYTQTDLVTYPSTIEGFGNAFLETIYYRRPIVVNNYSIFDVDIKPKGFRVIEFDGYITDSTVQQTQRVLSDPELAREMADENYRLAKRYYSYAMLKRRLQTLIADCFGEEDDH